MVDRVDRIDNSIFLLAGGGGYPEPSDNPDSPAVAVSIDSENLVELYRSLPNMRIIDVRHHEDYVQGHIETARNLPLAEADSAALDKLAKSAEQAMVLYCNGNAGMRALRPSR